MRLAVGAGDAGARGRRITWKIGGDIPGAHQVAARNWLSFIHSPTALSIFENYGFEPYTHHIEENHNE